MGSFLDTLLVAATGAVRTASVSGGGVLAVQAGQLALCDPTTGAITVQAPTNPAVGAFFGVADATAQSAVHAIAVTSVGALFVLESPASPGTYANSVSVASASRVRFWVYAGSTPGWKLIYGVF